MQQNLTLIRHLSNAGGHQVSIPLRHRMLFFFFTLYFTGFVAQQAYSQSGPTCSCTEYIYLNEPVTGVVHKFRVGANVALTEVTGANGGTTWYPGNTTSQFPSPHGIATDLNGRLYIGATGGGPIYRLNCDGVLDPTYTPINAQGATQSIFSIGNTIYANGNGIRAFNSCTGDFLGTSCYNLAGLSSNQSTLEWAWGISYNKNTQTVYATGRRGTDNPGKTVWAFSRAQLEAGIAGGPCIDPLVTQGTNATVNVGEKLTPAWDGRDIGGVTSDNLGNFYVVIGFEVFKYNSSGGFVAKGSNQAKIDSPIGVVWSESNRLYVSNYSDAGNQDCIAVFDATTMAYLGTGIPNPDNAINNTSKAIGILKECCPQNLPASFTREVCGGAGTKFYLNEEAFKGCDGIVCGSSWTPVGTPQNMTFDPCDNSVTVTGIGCATFTLNIGAVSSTGCPAQTSTFTICNIAPPAIKGVFTKTPATCTGTTDNNNGKIALTSAATIYNKFRLKTGTGAWSGDTTYATATSLGTLPKDLVTNGPNAGATYTIRFYSSDDCFRDTTVTLASKSCACTLTLKPTVSGCYQNSGSSKATVSVEVSWSNIAVSPVVNNEDDRITVTLAGQTRYINPGLYASTGGSGTIVSPQVVAFEVLADASTQTVQAFVGADFASSTCKIEQTGISLPAACPPTECTTGQTGGTVWNDFNADGIKQPGETAGVPGITVKAYDCNGNVVGTATTDVFGKYVFSPNIAASAFPIRVEFTNLLSFAGQGTLNGTDGRTTVQFVNAADCSIDLGVLDPNDYCQSNPKIIVPCYLNGDPLDAGSANDAGMVSINYDLTGSKTTIAKIPELSSVWGIAYNKFDKHVYTATFLRRHVGLRPEGLGGIFKTDLATNTTTTLVDVENIGVNLGTIGDNASRGLNIAKTQPSADAEAFAKIGKVGMGDLDISSDGSTLYFVNLFEKKLHRLNIANPTSAPGVAIPNPNCGASGDYRPWALKIYKGKAYVGVVCDAQDSQSKSDLRAFVYAYDLTTNTFNPTPVFDFPLTYPKGSPSLSASNITGWYPWTDDEAISFKLVAPNSPGNGEIIYPQPIFTDIEFDIDGSMVLGFGDRFGFQTGVANFAPSGTGSYGNIVGGDILRAYSNGVSFVLENNAKVGLATGSSPNNNQGPGFGEFYNDDFFYLGNLAHSENSLGGLAIRPGSGETVYSAMDPLTDVIASGGFRLVNNTTGLNTASYSVYSGGLAEGLFAKAAGIGDVELTCDVPTYLEIGNRVWNDVNKNGVQDPCEKALKDVNVTLYKGSTKIATTKTDVNGEYYFSTKSKIGAGWIGTGADTTLLPNTAYKLVFGEGQLTGGKLTVAGLGQFDLTVKDATASNGNDQNDSDAEIVSGAFCINLTTGALATVNHTFDAGFYCINPPIAATFTQTAATCNVLNPNNDGKVTLTASVVPYDKFRTRLSTAAWGADSSYTTATAIGSTFPVDLVTTTPNAGATYVIRFYAGECCNYKDTTITVTPTSCACVTPTRTVAATDPTCTVAGKIELTATNGDKYGVSKGATYTGPANASATTVGTLPILIKGNISHAADSTWTIRVFNKDNTCFKDTTVTVKALVKDATVSVANGFPVCRSNGTAYTIKFIKTPAGSVVTAKNVATGAAIPVTGDSVANIALTVAKVRLIVTNGICKDSIEVDAPVCDKPVGSIGDLIWKDTNDNGLQDLPTEKGVAGVKVNLYAAAGGTKTGNILQTKITGTDGLYLFTGLLAGDYIVEIDKTSLKDTCAITTKQNIPSDDTKDSDFNPTSGLSQVITLNPVFNPTTPTEILATNNLTVDAGLVVPCLKSKVILTAAPVCSADVQTYSLSFSVNNKVGTVKVNKGVLTGSNPYTVTGIPSGATIKITDSLSAVCKFDTLITGPNCNCNPLTPTLITPSLTACIGDTFPTIKATVIGLATVEWFATATSTTVLFTGLNYKPAGTVSAAGAMFYAQARSTDPSCPSAISTSRVMATVNAQNCTVEVDLALKKSINTKIAQIGDVLTYTLKVWNESNTNATGVEVTDSIATTVQFQAGSFTASRGGASITGNVIKWTVGNIAAGGDTVTLTYRVKATQEGVHFNTAEISKVNEKDVDSTPGNGKEGEDDIDHQCFTVPIKLCPGEKAEANVPASLTNVQWFKNGGSTAVATGNVVLLTEVGTYTFTATNQTCPANGCCPIIIEPGVNCCPEDLCIPFTIKKRRK